VSKLKAHPFAALLGLKPPRLPVTEQVSVVVAGRRVRDVRQVEQSLVDADRNDDRAIAEARQLQDAVRTARRKAADKRYRNKADYDRSWAQRHPDKMAAYRKAWRERNAERVVKDAHEYFKRRYYSDVEASRAKNREYYAKNRDRILARQKQRNAERKAAEAAASMSNGSEGSKT
jgi:hypothetical protein